MRAIITGAHRRLNRGAQALPVDVVSRVAYHDHLYVVTGDAMERYVGIRKLRDELTKHLGRVRRGGRIVVTDRGRPVAVLLPHGPGAEPELDERLKRVLSSGHILPAEKPFSRLPPLVAGRGPLLSRLVAEGRR
jgi:prevent-host-death family protein